MGETNPGIMALQYLSAGIFILGFAYQIPIFFNISGGIMLGCSVGSFLVWRIEYLDMKAKIKIQEEHMEKMKKLREKLSETLEQQ